MACLPTINLEDQFSNNDFEFSVFIILFEAEILKISSPTTRSCCQNLIFCFSGKRLGSIDQTSPILDHWSSYFLKTGFTRSTTYFYLVKNELYSPEKVCLRPLLNITKSGFRILIFPTKYHQKLKQDTRLPPGYLPPSNFVKKCKKCVSKKKCPISVRSISHLLFFPILQKFGFFFKKLKISNYGCKKAFLGNINILAAFYIKFDAFPNLWKNRFFFQKKSKLFGWKALFLNVLKKPHYFIRILRQTCFILVT